MAAVAWAHYESAGRGAMLVTREELHRAGAQYERGETPIMRPTYFLAEHVPKDEDFRAVMLEYDPTREILLIIGGDGEQDELLLRLSCDEHSERLPPEQCCRRVRNAQ